jgi:hypothetical protein
MTSDVQHLHAHPGELNRGQGVELSFRAGSSFHMHWSPYYCCALLMFVR